MARPMIRLVVVAVALLVITVLTGPTQTAYAQTNLLNNPGFDGSGSTATGWSPWHREANTTGDCGSEAIYHRPTWNVEVAGGDSGQLWRDGVRSQQIGNQFATWHAGVVQDVEVNPGARLRFAASAWGRASQDQYPATSDRGVNLNVRVGIDPTGSGLWSSSSIVWSAPINPHDAWQEVAVEATASGSRVSVFIGADLGGAGQCRKHMDVWFDAASLTETTPPQPTNTPPTIWPTNTPTQIPPTATPAPPTNTPTPAATSTPVPTPLPTGPWFTATPVPATPVPVVVNTPVPAAPPPPAPVVIVATAVPTDEPATEAPAEEESAESPSEGEGEAVAEAPAEQPAEVEPSQPSGGTICVNTFSDENANGLRDDLEGYMAGIALLIGQSGGVVGQGVSTGTDESVCFEGLIPGTYEIAQRLPGSLEMTTAGNMELAVEEGQTIGLEFGSRIKPATEGEAVEEVAEVVVSDSNEGASSESAEPEPTAVTVSDAQSEAPAANNSNLTAFAGIGVLSLAVVLLGGILVALLRR